MDPRDYWQALRKSWVVVLILVIVGGGVAYAYGQSKANVYQSTSSVFVSATQGSTSDALVQGSTYAHNVVASYATLATTPAVLTPVIDELGLDTTPARLAGQVSASNPLDTLFVQVTVSNTSPRQAADIANAVARSLRTVATSLAPTTSAHTPSITLSIVEPAQVPTHPKAPNRRLILITGLVLGLVAGILFSLGRFLLDTRLRRQHDVEAFADAPVVGTVRRGDSSVHGVALVAAPGSDVAEDYRRIRATLQHAGVSGALDSLLVTSPVLAPAAATLALNVALATAERAKSVLVVDANLRTAPVTALTGLNGATGLTDVLDGSTDLTDAVQVWQPNVDVLTAGSPLSNPHFALGSASLAETLDAAKAAYDLVVVVTPPVLAYSDALTLVPLVEGSLVDATAAKTTRPQLKRTLAALEGVGAYTLGVVLTGVKERSHAPRSAAPAPAAALPTAHHPEHASEEPAGTGSSRS